MAALPQRVCGTNPDPTGALSPARGALHETRQRSRNQDAALVSTDANRLMEPLDCAIARLEGDWRSLVDRWRQSPAGQALVEHVDARVAAGAVVYPADVFAALRLTPLSATRVVIVGQDPYHGPGQAEGLAFSVPARTRIPPSLRNILAEAARSRSTQFPHAQDAGHLGGWARAGVLLLNTSLTVEDGQPASHARKGWEALTDALLLEVAKTASPCVYLLWGAHAQAKADLIQTTAAQHDREALVLQANHPSPLSASRPPTPFLGCGHFVQARAWLAARGCHDVF